MATALPTETKTIATSSPPLASSSAPSQVLDLLWKPLDMNPRAVYDDSHANRPRDTHTTDDDDHGHDHDDEDDSSWQYRTVIAAPVSALAIGSQYPIAHGRFHAITNRIYLASAPSAECRCSPPPSSSSSSTSNSDTKSTAAAARDHHRCKIASERITHVFTVGVKPFAYDASLGVITRSWLNVMDDDHDFRVTLMDIRHAALTILSSSPTARILVHCYAGSSRSPAVVAAILARTSTTVTGVADECSAMDSAQTLVYIAKKAPWIYPLESFQYQLGLLFG